VLHFLVKVKGQNADISITLFNLHHIVCIDAFEYSDNQRAKPSHFFQVALSKRLHYPIHEQATTGKPNQDRGLFVNCLIPFGVTLQINRLNCFVIKIAIYQSGHHANERLRQK